MTDRKSSYAYDDLIACGNGQLFGAGNAQLPKPPMLMMDRITSISETGGALDKGHMYAELDVRPDLWFFECHFNEDPVMPGCLGLDAMWQMVGFYLGWLGNPGRGRALAAGAIKFSGQILPTCKIVRYELSFKRVITGRLSVGIADGLVFADDEQIYEAQDLRVGLFKPAEEA